jgi:hypothetical protein
MAVGPALPETSIALDNDIFTHWRSQQPYVLKAINEYFSNLKRLPSLTSMTVFEALAGFERLVAKSGQLDPRTQQARDSTDRLIQNCIVLPFNQTAAIIAA